MFETLEHGGDYPDTMPQALQVTDAEGSVLPLCADPKPPYRGLHAYPGAPKLQYSTATSGPKHCEAYDPT